MADYDLVVIGAGWAGLNASWRARDLGLKVLLVEKDQIGGVCLNRGCIPTKTLIHSAKIYKLTQKSSLFGIEIPSVKINFLKIKKRKEEIIQKLRTALESSLRGIDFLNAQAEILSSHTLKINDKEITTRFILLATGSSPLELENLKFDGKKILSSDTLLNLEELPSSLLIIGGGVIGCEFASFFASLGCPVTIVEKLPQLLPGEDKEVARKLEVIFKKKGINVNTNTDATKIDLKAYPLVLLCIGRIPNLEGLENLKIKIEKGKILVDDYLRTSIPNIYAAGDCTAKIMLAHFAAYQGRLAAENIFQQDNPKKLDITAIANCIFTDPEIARVGLTEEETKKFNLPIKIYRFDFLASGMSRILDETEGFIKIISHKDSQEILGASIIGPEATELIGIFTLATKAKLKIPDLKKTIFAHPTLSEGIFEAVKNNGI